MKHAIYLFVLILFLAGCKAKPKGLAPVVVTETLPHDSDDPAIWIHPVTDSLSVVFGTDKETDGGVYAFDLKGKIIDSLSIKGLQRPNNVDVGYGLMMADSSETDYLVVTERERMMLRVYAVPSMKPLDNGGVKVFSEATLPEHNLPMGIAVYYSSNDKRHFVIVGRKNGPLTNYLEQYEMVSDSTGFRIEKVRTFGNFSGIKEIEAIAVDQELGYVYYSDEGECIRKYYAHPDKGGEELACFGREYFKDDIEGIAIAGYEDGTGYILVSNQQDGSFVIFDRQSNDYLGTVYLSTLETDGCEVYTRSLGREFPNGLFVAMNDERNFHFHDLDKVLGFLNAEKQDEN